MPGPDKSPYARIALTNWRMTVHRGRLPPRSVIARRRYAATLGKISVRSTIRYTRTGRTSTFEWNIEDKTPDPIPEGGWLCLPFAIDHPQFKLGRLGSIIDPAKDIITGGNRKLLCLNSGMTITGPDGNGVGLCPLDSPLVSLGEPGLWKYSDDYVPAKANVYINLYNNMWNTNFPLWQDGSWTLAGPHLGGPRRRQRKGPHHALVGGARCRCWPPSPTARRGNFPPTASGLALSRRGVLLTAFGDNPDGAGTCLRVWEQAGASGELTVTLPASTKFATAPRRSEPPRRKRRPGPCRSRTATPPSSTSAHSRRPHLS